MWFSESASHLKVNNLSRALGLELQREKSSFLPLGYDIQQINLEAFKTNRAKRKLKTLVLITSNTYVEGHITKKVTTMDKFNC